jgi:hypothetical protein
MLPEKNTVINPEDYPDIIRCMGIYHSPYFVWSKKLQLQFYVTEYNLQYVDNEESFLCVENIEDDINFFIKKGKAHLLANVL